MTVQNNIEIVERNHLLFLLSSSCPINSPHVIPLSFVSSGTVALSETELSWKNQLTWFAQVSWSFHLNTVADLTNKRRKRQTK
jgi:hypothetical protein